MSWKPFVALLAVSVLSAAAAPLHAQSCTASTATGSSAWVNNPGTTPPSTVPGNESNHCDFAQFSWQSFLALMQVGNTGTGQLVFETYMDTDGMFPASGSPNAWGDEPWPLTLTEITQAGSGNDIIAQNKSEVYYDMSVDQTMYNYINTNMLYNPTCFNAGTMSTIHMPPTSSSDTADESIELKTAWLPMTSCNPKQYHCITALINGQKTTVGLIGIHIVHKLPDHQEWIWSSFEHVDNAPDCAQITNPPSGYSSWNFFKTGFVSTGSACSACASDDGSGCDASTQCNAFVSETQVPNICRVTPLATVTCNSSDSNLNDDPNNTACLNASVQSILGSSSVWNNYQLVGTIWFKPGMSAPATTTDPFPPYIPGTTTQQQIVGNQPSGTSAQMLSNSVMETYTQQQNGNCFGCHTTAYKQYTSGTTSVNSGHADFSHIFNRIQSTNTGGTCPTLTTVASHGAETKKKTEATAYAPTPKPASSHGKKN
jgi:hypothetical protein